MGKGSGRYVRHDAREAALRHGVLLELSSSHLDALLCRTLLDDHLPLYESQTGRQALLDQIRPVCFRPLDLVYESLILDTVKSCFALSSPHG